MKKLLLPALLALAVARPLASLAQACPAPNNEVLVGSGTRDVTPGFTLPSSTTWTRNNIYILNGTVYVPNGVTLTIEAGTIIKGDRANRGTLLVQPGGRLIAQGTPTQPIVFTSRQPAGARASGDWGGIIILGRAPVNLSGSPSIEGGLFGTNGTFGGTNPTDNSGILRYVRIEYPGFQFQVGNEINGLTLGGVGSGTDISYVQVSNCDDDSFEWFGGTVNAKYLIAQSGVDDDFDTDNGFSGRVQFALGIRDPQRGDIGAGGVSNGIESDNDATSSAGTPQTSAVFSNFSILTPTTPTPASPYNLSAGALIRRNSAQSLFNSLLVGRRFGLEINNSSANPTSVNAQSGALALANNILVSLPFSSSLPARAARLTGTAPTVAFNINQFIAATNDTTQTIATLGLNADNFQFNGNCANNPQCVPNFTLPAASPAASGASFANTKLQAAAGNGGPNSTFDVVNFRGAFGPAGTPYATWANGWTNFNPQNTCYNVAGQTLSTQNATAPFRGLSVSPNPTEGVTAVLNFEVTSATPASVRVMDLAGRVVANVASERQFGLGQQRLTLPGTLSAGLYVVTIQTGDAVRAVRFVVSK